MKIAFTGHRPENKNLGGYNYSSPKNKMIMNNIRKAILKVLKNHNALMETNHFIFGGALGIDQMCFEEVYKMKQEGIIDCILEIAIPFKKQSSKWLKESVNVYNSQIERADILTYVDTLDKYKVRYVSKDIFHPEKLIKRNEYMVDKSDTLIGVWDGSRSGGTWRTVSYANKIKKETIIVNPKNL